MGFWDDLTGKTAANASKAAAADTYAKQQAAGNALRGYGDQYAGEFKNLAENYQPYMGAGNSALARLMEGLGLGGNGEAFTNAYRNLPGYQAGLDTGSRAVTTSAAARGGVKNGGTLKALMKFGSNYEDQRAGDYLGRLAGVGSMGLQGTAGYTGLVGQGLQGQLGTRQTAYGGDMTAAGTIGQGDIAAANARAAGSQNLLNTGLKIGGMALGAMTGNPMMMMGSMGGGGSPSAYGAQAKWPY